MSLASAPKGSSSSFATSHMAVKPATTTIDSVAGVVGEDDIILHYQSLGGLLLSPREVDAMIETVSVIDKKYLEPKFDDDMIEEVEDRGFDFCEFSSYATWRLASEEPDARIWTTARGCRR